MNVNTKVFKNAKKCVYRLAFIKVYKSKKVWLREEKKRENVIFRTVRRSNYMAHNLDLWPRAEKKNVTMIEMIVENILFVNKETTGDKDYLRRFDDNKDYRFKS